jgi:hypothetical protein
LKGRATAATHPDGGNIILVAVKLVAGFVHRHSMLIFTNCIPVNFLSIHSVPPVGLSVFSISAWEPSTISSNFSSCIDANCTARKSFSTAASF